MESRSHGVLINAAGFIYASLGFSLSVLAALFSIFSRRKKEDATTIPFHTLPAARGRRPVRPSPVTPQTILPEKAAIPSAPSSPIKIPQQPQRSKTNLRRSVSAHELRYSKSMLPIITVDYFGSPDSPHRITSSTEVVVIGSPQTTDPKDTAPAVIPFVKPPSSSPPASISSTSSESNSKHDRSGFRILHPKSWGKDKSKNIQRRQSSPHICPVPALCPSRPSQPSSHKQTASDGSMISSDPPVPVKRDVKASRSRSLLRKMPSLPQPTHEKHGVETPPRTKSDKKRSQTLRTHPYEAPYFAMPPLPPLPPAYRDIVSPTSPPSSKNIDKKRSKPRLTSP